MSTGEDMIQGVLFQKVSLLGFLFCQLLSEACGYFIHIQDILHKTSLLHILGSFRVYLNKFTPHLKEYHNDVGYKRSDDSSPTSCSKRVLLPLIASCLTTALSRRVPFCFEDKSQELHLAFSFQRQSNNSHSFQPPLILILVQCSYIFNIQYMYITLHPNFDME